MTCSSCKRPARIQVTYNNTRACASCFEQSLFKRVKRVIRKYRMIVPNTTYYLVDNGSTPARFLVRFFKTYFPKPVFDIRVVSHTKKVPRIESCTLTNASNAFLHAMFTKSKYNLFLASRGIARPLISTTNEELAWLAKAHKEAPRFFLTHVKEDAFIKELETRRNMVRFSFLRFIDALE